LFGSCFTVAANAPKSRLTFAILPNTEAKQFKSYATVHGFAFRP
jgi:hypothetical protein